MNEVIDILTKLGNIPIVNILLGAFLVAFATYLFTIKQKKSHDERVTKQVLSFINSEIYESFTNRINSEYPYNELSLKGIELLNIQAGNIKINNDQLAKINKIYALFDEINKNILTIREGHHTVRGLTALTPANKLKKLQDRCIVFAGEYVREIDSE
jgi:hypothetical protein